MIYDKAILNAIYSFGRINTANLLYVAGGLKSCARLTVHNHELPEFSHFVHYLSLTLLVGFNDIGHPPSPDKNREWCQYNIRNVHNEGFVFVYVGKNVRILEALRYYDEECNDIRVGLLLGYPRCCISNYKLSVTHQSDYHLRYEEGKQYDHVMNIFSFSFDSCYFEHIPCTLSCRPTQQESEKKAQFLKENFDTLSNCFESLTRSSVLYTQHHGLYLFKNTFLERHTTAETFEIIKLSSQSKVGESLKDANRLTFGSDGVFIDDNIFLKDEYRLFNFV